MVSGTVRQADGRILEEPVEIQEKQPFSDRGILHDHVRGIFNLERIRIAVSTEVKRAVPILDEERVPHPARRDANDFHARERERAE